jgi:thiol-activated cytolysin
MKSIRSILHILLGVTLICSCNEATELAHITPNVSLIKYKDIVKIDSLYTYPGDSLYQNWINQYNKNLEDKTNMSIDIISMTKYNNIINIDSSETFMKDSITNSS